MKINIKDIKYIVSECVKNILSEQHIYTYQFKCNDLDNADYIQQVTGYDPQFSNNIYNISDSLLERDIIKIINKEKFNILTNNFDFKQLTKHPITYYALNTKFNILFAYCEENDIHYFFK